MCREDKCLFHLHNGKDYFQRVNVSIIHVLNPDSNTTLVLGRSLVFLITVQSDRSMLYAYIICMIYAP